MSRVRESIPTPMAGNASITPPAGGFTTTPTCPRWVLQGGSGRPRGQPLDQGQGVAPSCAVQPKMDVTSHPTPAVFWQEKLRALGQAPAVISGDGCGIGKRLMSGRSHIRS